MLLLENDGKIVKSDAQKKKVNNLLHESDPVAAYLSSHLDLADRDSTVTSEEILKAFHAYCKEQKWTLPPRKDVQARIPDYIFRYYGISKRTDIKRAGTNRRGYQGLRFK